MELPIYLDHNATTPVSPEVLQEMIPFFTKNFGNASSVDHEIGMGAKKAVDIARETLANCFGADTDEIVFTSGATESDNIAIIGVAEAYQAKGKHIITCQTEHKAVLDSCKFLESKGWEVTYLPVNRDGLISLDQLRAAIKKETVLISIMYVNNEIGVIQPIQEIGLIAREFEVFFHTDAAQASGHLRIDVDALNIDLMSISGHKIFGPKGIGALYIRKRKPRVHVVELTHGGGHERGIRSGTLNVPGIVGLSKAINMAISNLENDQEHLKKISQLFFKNIRSGITTAKLNGSPIERLPNNLNIYLPGIDNRSLLVLINNYVCISLGSACTTLSVEPSHVIEALGIPNAAHQSIRIGFGKNNTIEEIQFASNMIIEKSKLLLSLNI